MSLYRGVSQALGYVGEKRMRLRGQADRRWVVVIAAIVLIAILAIVAYFYFIQPI